MAKVNTYKALYSHLRQLHLCILALGLVVLSSCQNENPNALRIASAANMRFALETIVEEFESQSGVKCEIVYASSGKLCAQIESGAPYDVFLSADYHYPKYLHDLSLANEPELYAYGQLILWSKTYSQEELTSSWINDPSCKVAVADSILAPYGQATHAYLTNRDILGSIANRIVTGESISQVNQFVHTGAAKIGFTSHSTIKADIQDLDGAWMLIDKSLYPPIEQCASILTTKEIHPQAALFLDFLLSEKGQKVLSQYGYLPVETQMEQSDHQPG